MATGGGPPASGTAEEIYYLRLFRLSKVGSEAVRITFDRLVPPSTLVNFLKTHESTFRRQPKKVLGKFQLDTLFPTAPGVVVQSAQFDTTLMICVIRIVNLLPTPLKRWDALPNISEATEEAHLARVKWYRNELVHNSLQTLSKNDYKMYKRDLINAINGLDPAGTLKTKIDQALKEEIIPRHVQVFASLIGTHIASLRCYNEKVFDDAFNEYERIMCEAFANTKEPISDPETLRQLEKYAYDEAYAIFKRDIINYTATSDVEFQTIFEDRRTEYFGAIGQALQKITEFKNKKEHREKIVLTAECKPVCVTVGGIACGFVIGSATFGLLGGIAYGLIGATGHVPKLVHWALTPSTVSPEIGKTFIRTVSGQRKKKN